MEKINDNDNISNKRKKETTQDFSKKKYLVNKK